MNRRETLRRIAREARPYSVQIGLALVLGTLGGLVNLVPPWAFNQIISRVLAPKSGRSDLHVLYVALAVTFLALLIGNLAIYFQTYVTSWSGQHLIAKLRVQLFERVLKLPLSEFDRWRPGELMARFSTDLQMMSDAVSVSLPQLVVAIVTFVSSLIAMIYLDWLLTLTLVVVAPVISLVVSRFQKLITSSTQRTQARVADLSAYLSELLQSQRIVKAFGREDYEVARFRTRNDDYFGAFMKLTQFVQTQPLIIGTFMIAAVVVITWLSVREVLVGRLETGTVFAYWMLLVNLVNPMNRLAAFFSDISKALVGSGRIFEILDLPTENYYNYQVQTGMPQMSQSNSTVPPVRGQVTFENVTFYYRGNNEIPALDNVNVTINAGEIVAFVGPSGAGKTTFINLVLLFYVPQQGRIMLDGVNTAAMPLAQLRNAIAIVPQDPQLFRASIAENIRYGRLEATDEQVQAAAREANADEFIRLLPDGYVTEVGERGVRLSGGERQRIAIARAILRDPRILILDEATSALDSHSEALIEQALDRLLPGRTTLMIAHRLSTIRRAHRILYVEAGRIVEMGSHEELLARGGAYARLYAKQFVSTT